MSARPAPGPEAVPAVSLGGRRMLAARQAFVPALAFPILFLHVNYQPKVTFGAGSTTVGIELSDIAVLAVVVAAVAVARREGWRPLRASRLIWILGALLLALIVAATGYPLLRPQEYHFLSHLVTAAKFCEYALLAPSLALLLRRSDDAAPLLWSAVLWSAIASGWALLQFAGVVNELEGKRPLQREPSFVGIHDFAALSGASLAVGFAVLALGGRTRRERVLGTAAGAAGVIGLALSGAVTGVLGIALVGAAVLFVAYRRGHAGAGRPAALAALVVVAAAGVLLLRGGELAKTARQLGIGARPHAERSVQSYTERSLMAYIGLRMFSDHPVIGVGWQGSTEAGNYGPYLAPAHRHFPDVPDVAFPSPAHPWGMQNAYLQTATDLGIVGILVLGALLAAVVAAGLRVALRAPPSAAVPAICGLLWLLVAVGVWNGLGLVAGIPLDALTWLGVGLVASALAWPRDAAHE